VRYSDGLVEGIASFDGEMIFTTQPADVGGGVLGNFGAYELNTSTDAITQVWTAAGQSNHGALSEMAQITIDPATGEYYVSTQPGDIYAGNLDGSQAPTLLVNANTISGLTGNVAAEELSIDPAATVSGISVAGIDGNAGITTGEIGTSDVVTIVVTFDSAVTVSDTPALSLNDGGNAFYTSGSGSEVLYFTYTPSNGQDAKPLAVTGFAFGPVTDGIGQVADLSGATATFNGLVVDTTPPSLTLSGTSTEAVQGGGAALVLASAAISDPDGDGALSGAVVRISGYQAGDVLGINGATSGTASGIAYSAANGTLSLTGDAADASYAALLGAVTYQDTGTDTSTGAHPTRTLNWSVTENTAGGALTGNAQTEMKIERPPVVSGGGTVDYTAGGAAVAVDSSLGVQDPDAQRITGAQIAIGTGFLAGDQLTAVTTGLPSIIASYNAATGVLSLTAADTPADYQAELESVAFSSTLSDPTDGGADDSRTIDFQVTGTDGLSSGVVEGSVDVAICYLHGTQILTPTGQVAVEDLCAGDPVVHAGREDHVWFCLWLKSFGKMNQTTFVTSYT
jgi:hypothetical protein